MKFHRCNTFDHACSNSLGKSMSTNVVKSDYNSDTLSHAVACPLADQVNCSRAKAVEALRASLSVKKNTLQPCNLFFQVEPSPKGNQTGAQNLKVIFQATSTSRSTSSLQINMKLLLLGGWILHQGDSNKQNNRLLALHVNLQVEPRHCKGFDFNFSDGSFLEGLFVLSA